jgi:hypothetical protein
MNAEICQRDVGFPSQGPRLGTKTRKGWNVGYKVSVAAPFRGLRIGR